MEGLKGGGKALWNHRMQNTVNPAPRYPPIRNISAYKSFKTNPDSFPWYFQDRLALRHKLNKSLEKVLHCTRVTG